MLRLVLIRHAKSSWEIPGQHDHDRRLNARGRAAAPLIARWMAGHDLVPAHGLVSSAIRSRETWDLLCSIWGEVPATETPDLYEAEPEAILGTIRRAPASRILALVGHNPAIGEAARRLLVKAPADPSFNKYPTAATTVIGFDAPDWSGIDWRDGTFLDFVIPKRLATTGW